MQSYHLKKTSQKRGFRGVVRNALRFIFVLLVDIANDNSEALEELLDYLLDRLVGAKVCYDFHKQRKLTRSNPINPVCVEHALAGPSKNCFVTLDPLECW